MRFTGKKINGTFEGRALFLWVTVMSVWWLELWNIKSFVLIHKTLWRALHASVRVTVWTYCFGDAIWPHSGSCCSNGTETHGSTSELSPEANPWGHGRLFPFRQESRNQQSITPLTNTTAHYCDWWNPLINFNTSLFISMCPLIRSWILLTGSPHKHRLPLLLSRFLFRMWPRFQALLVLTDMWKECCVTAVQPHLSCGTEAPLRCTTVGNRSMLLVGSSTCLPPGMLPGHRSIPGTRIPPSQFVDFPAAQG